MRNKLKKIWSSLTGRLMICLAASLIGMAAIAVQSFTNSWQESQNEAYEEFTVVGSKMQAELTDMFDSYETVARMVGYFTAVQRYLTADDPEVVIQSFSPAENYLNTVKQLSDSCANIYLYSYNGRHLYADIQGTESFNKLLRSRMLEDDVTVSRPFFAQVPRNGGSPYVFYCVPIYCVESYYPTNRIIAVILCDMDQITRRIAGDSEGTQSRDAAVLLYSGSIVSSTRSLNQEEQAMLAEIPEGRGTLDHSGVRYLTTRISMPERYWDFIYFIPETEIAAQALRSMNQGLLPLCVAVVLVAAFLSFLIFTINKSIRQITDDINRLNYDTHSTSLTHIQEPRLTELNTIARSANHMLDRLNETFQKEQQIQQRLHQAIQAQNQAKIMGYRSQINPHFLFNTLECMRSMAHSSGENDMETLISSMALTFRYSLHSGTVVTLSQELSHVQSYFAVIRIRFPGRYSLRVSADPAALEHTMLSMILQPIVENAINHAFADRESGCRILIQAFPKGGARVIRVTDNGSGMGQKELEALEHRMRTGAGEPAEGRSSIGLHNIFQRMKLTFGDHFHIRFRSKKGYYTSVELTIPEAPALPPFQETLKI